MDRDSETVTVSVDGDVREGRAVDLRDCRVDGRTVARAVRADPSGAFEAAEASASGADRARASDVETVERCVRVACPDPGPLHDRVGFVGPSVNVRVRTALAAAARSRGLTAPQDDEVRALRDRLAAVDDPETPDLADARRRLAGTAASVERLRERVATLRGRVQAGREAGRDVSDIESDLADATRALSERETERTAAREALERARRLARERRDARERRRRVEDRLGNAERAARAHLVDAVREEFAAAVAAVPDPDRESGNVSDAAVAADVATEVPGGAPSAVDDPFAVDDATAALAVCRVADLRAPVVLACDRFASPARAAEWLGAPVIRTSPVD